MGQYTKSKFEERKRRTRMIKQIIGAIILVAVLILVLKGLESTSKAVKITVNVVDTNKGEVKK